MNRKATVIITAVVLAIMGYVVVGSMTRVQVTCEICVEFNGGRRCTRGAGATPDEAKQGAQTAACGVLASGMDQTIRCQNTPPASATCTD